MSRKKMIFIAVWVGIAASLSYAEFQRDEPRLGLRILVALAISAVVMLGLYFASEWLANRKSHQGDSKKNEDTVRQRWVIFGIIFLLIVYASFLISPQQTTTQSNVASQGRQNVPPQNITLPKSSPKLLTKEEFRQRLIQDGLNPDDYDLDNLQQAPPSTTQSVSSNIHYLITVTDGTGHQESYFSEKEPKPYGSGYKFKMAGTEIEITVSGNVQIMRIR